MDLQKEREAFNAWVVTHPDNIDITDYEERIMFDAWRAAKAQSVPEGFVLVPINPSEDAIDKLASVICDEFDTTISGSAHCASEAYKAMIEAQEPKFNLDEFLSMEEKLKSKGGVIAADLDRFIAYAEMVLEKAKAFKEPK